jgi:parallel beta-helix repeat protein
MQLFPARNAAAAAMVLALLCGAAEAKTFRIKPGEAAEASFEAALLQAQEGDRIRFGKGRFEFTRGFQTRGPGVRIEGSGPDATVLAFRSQKDGLPALQLPSAARLRGFTIEDAMNGAVLAEGGDGYAFQNLAVRYTEPSRIVTADGFDFIGARNVLMDTVAVTGAPDAGVAFSQSSNIVLRNLVLEENGVGAALLDTNRVDFYDSALSGNALGLAVADFAQVQGESASMRIFRNQIVRNDKRARPSSLLGLGAPPAVGVLIVAAHDLHLFENTIGDHGGANLVMLSTSGSPVDPAFVPVPFNLMIRDNVLGRSGYAPQGQLETLRGRGVAIPDVLWDGVESFGEGAAKRTLPVRISLLNNLKNDGSSLTFLSLGVGRVGGSIEQAKPSTTPPAAGAIVEPAPVVLPRL